MPSRPAPPRRLSRAEAVTTGVAVVASSTGYVLGGHAYLARGVVGDLVGFAVLLAVLLLTGRRLRHEALLCLALIGGVLLLDPQWPLRVGDGWWWAAWSAGLTAYLVPRQLRAPSD